MNNKKLPGSVRGASAPAFVLAGGGADMFPPLNNNRLVRLVRSVPLRRGFPAGSGVLTVCERSRDRERERVTSWASWAMLGELWRLSARYNEILPLEVS